MDVFNLEARLGLNSEAYEEGLRRAERGISAFGNRLQSGFSVAVRAIGAGIAAGAAGITALTTQSVRQYSEFEQLVGGTELLFGEAYDYVMERSQNAYANVQMSQSQYLQQVNGFAVGLSNALGGNEQAAAELADSIITAEADIVAATGNSQEAVQNAFNGVMRGNYTMLDNLGLGINATQEGVQQVIDSVNEWNAAQGRATQYTIDNVADVQSALVDYVEMQGLSGYATNEASETIQGSIASMKAAWNDLLVSFADPNADIGTRISNMVDTASTAFYNILPAALNAVSGIGTFIQQIAPMVEEQLPTLVDSLLPPILSAAITLVEGIVNALPSILSALTGIIPQLLTQLIPAILEIIPQLTQAGFDLLNGLISGINEALPILFPLATDIIVQFIGLLTSPSNLGTLIENAVQFATLAIDGLVTALPTILNAIIEAIPSLLDAIIPAVINFIPTLLNALITIAGAIIEALPRVINTIITYLPTLINMIVTALPTLLSQIIPAIIRLLPQIIQAGISITLGLMRGITQALPTLLRMLPTLIRELVSSLLSADNLSVIIESGLQIITAIIQGITEAVPMLLELLPELMSTVLELFRELTPMMIELAIGVLANLVTAILENSVNFIEAIVVSVRSQFEMFVRIFADIIGFFRNQIELVKSYVRNAITFVSNLIENIRDFVSRVVENISEFFADGIEYWKTTINNGITAIKNFFTNGFDNVKNTVSTTVENIRTFFTNGVENWKNTISNAIDSIKNFFTNGLDNVKNTVSNALDSVKNFFTNTKNSVVDTVSGWIDTISGYLSLDTAVSNVTNTLNSIKDTFTDIFDTVKSTVSNAIDYIRDLFDFEWSLPSIALPHFSISGSLSLNPPSVPRVSVSWYKRGYSEAMLLNDPTIFGMAGGRLLGGGEGNGSEAVVGTNLLMNMIGAVVESKLAALNLKVYLDTGELVGGIAPTMDSELGRLAVLDDKGVY